jgi:hypothetical protein
MLHTPVSKTKTETTQSKSQLASLSKREHHPFLPDIGSQHILSSDIGNAMASHVPEVQRQQTVAGLQATYGNQAVLHTLHTSPQVARMIPLRPSQGVILQRKCACGGSSEAEGECAECKEEREGTLQRRAVNANAAPAGAQGVPSIVHDVLRSPGQPLDASTRDFMEPRFVHDFSQVRVHTDTKAEESASAVNALAYTVGKDVVIGSGQYAPRTSEGKKLMAHELTHVMQQGRVNMRRQLNIGQVNDAHEHEADTAAKFIGSTSAEQPFSVRIGSGGPLLQRQTITDDDLDQADTEQAGDDIAVYDGDTPVIGIDTSEDPGEQIETEGTTVAEAINPEFQDVTPAQAGATEKEKPKAPTLPKKVPPKKITRIDVDLGAQKLTITWSDGSQPITRTISSGKGLPDTSDDPCKTQKETNCTPVGDEFKITSKGDENTKNTHGDHMSWYVGIDDTRGIGIHDSQPVTGKPASHGCIRIDEATAKLINKNIVKGSTEVHISGKAETKPWKSPPKKSGPNPSKQKSTGN